jgi:hypothetical protein
MKKEFEERLDKIETDVERMKERIRPKKVKIRGDPLVLIDEG